MSLQFPLDRYSVEVPNMNDEKNFQKAGEERMNDKADLFCSTSEHSGRHNTRIIRNDHVIVKKKKIKSLEQ
jgi:hypothetical protein